MFGFFKTRTEIKNKSRINFLKPFFQAFVYTSYLLFPLKCLKCQQIIHRNSQICQFDNKSHIELFKNYFCSECIKPGYEPFEPPFCEQCGKKFDHKYNKNHLCEVCLITSGNIGKVRAGARYLGIVKESIKLFKYKKKLALAKPLGKIIFSGFTEYFDSSDVDMIIPVPLHASKLRQRGFNQVFLAIKDNFSKDKIDLSVLKRVKKTEPQTLFSGEKRKENVKNAFKVIAPDKIKNKRMLLVDDVYTTGATASEAARKLIEAGALTVDVLVIAMT